MLQKSYFQYWNDRRNRAWNSYEINNYCREHDENLHDSKFLLTKKIEFKLWLTFEHNKMNNQQCKYSKESLYRFFENDLKIFDNTLCIRNDAKNVAKN